MTRRSARTSLNVFLDQPSGQRPTQQSRISCSHPIRTRVAERVGRREPTRSAC